VPEKVKTRIVTLYVVRDHYYGGAYNPEVDAPHLYTIANVRETALCYLWKHHRLPKDAAPMTGYYDTPVEAWAHYASRVEKLSKKAHEALTARSTQELTAKIELAKLRPSAGITTEAVCPGRGDGEGHAVREDGTCAFCYEVIAS
jgi:hypothetical protein